MKLKIINVVDNMFITVFVIGILVLARCVSSKPQTIIIDYKNVIHEDSNFHPTDRSYHLIYNNFNDNKLIEMEEDPISLITLKTYQDMQYPSGEVLEELERIVEAEVTGDTPKDFVWYGEVTQDTVIMAKVMVTRTILNRVRSDKFPNTIHEVIREKGQFSPFLDGRYWKVKITDSTREAVKLAFDEEYKTPMDYKGLYFSVGEHGWNKNCLLHRDNLGIGYFTKI